MAKKALLVVAQAGFQPVEYGDTRKALEEAGVAITVASFGEGEAIVSDLRNFAAKEDVAVLKKYVDLWGVIEV